MSADRRVFDAVSTEEPSSARTADSQDPEAANIRRSRAFWTLCAAQFLFFPSLATVPMHIAVHGIDLGMRRTTTATLLTVIGGASIVDRIGGRNTYGLRRVPLLAGLLTLLVVETHRALFAAVAVYGFAHGGLFMVVAPTVVELFGTRAHGATFGGIVFFGTLGAAVGPILAGRIFDVTGSYEYAFTGLAVMGRYRSGPGDFVAEAPGSVVHSSLNPITYGLWSRSDRGRRFWSLCRTQVRWNSW